MMITKDIKKYLEDIAISKAKAAKTDTEATKEYIEHLTRLECALQKEYLEAVKREFRKG